MTKLDTAPNADDICGKDGAGRVFQTYVLYIWKEESNRFVCQL